MKPPLHGPHGSCRKERHHGFSSSWLTDVHDYIAAFQLGGGYYSQDYSHSAWESQCQSVANDIVFKVSSGNYRPQRWHDIQDNKKDIIKDFLASNAKLDAGALAQKQQELEADLSKQERVIMLGKKLATYADSGSEFGRSVDELSKWMALDDETKAGATLALLKEKHPDELTAMLVADTKVDKGRFFESLLAATVDWMQLIGSPETYNPFSHLTLDARSDTRTPNRKIVSRSSTAEQSEDAELMGDDDSVYSDGDRYSFDDQSSLNFAAVTEPA
ncbi:hypothetical protein JCM24511_02281 [Saitozyma sp. JCM 24511]|nr:hypothetical protein JCM24511_02281 [Saitozyma sp. JCM 24511]